MSDDLHGARLVFVLAGEVLGGAERGAIDLATGLRDEHGAEVSILALDDRPGPARSLAQQRSIVWQSARASWEGSWPGRARSMVRFARRARGLGPDVLVSFTNAPNVFTSLSWRMAGARSAVWVQCDVGGTMRFGPRLFRRALRSAPVAVTAANHAVSWLVDRYGVDAARIHVVRGIVRVPAPRADGAAWRARLGIGADEVVAGMLAHFHTGKDHPIVIRAWRRVVDHLGGSGLRVPLLLAGRDAGTLEPCRQLVRELGLDGGVLFVGETDDVGGLLAAMDLAVFASPRELLPRGVLEPMAMGLPVAATDDPGTREAVGEPGAELVVRSGDHVALADVVLRLARDEELRARIGAANAALVRARHAPEVSIGAWAELVRGLVAARR